MTLQVLAYQVCPFHGYSAQKSLYAFHGRLPALEIEHRGVLPLSYILSPWFLFLFFCFETGSHWVAETGLQLLSSCLSLLKLELDTGITTPTLIIIKYHLLYIIVCDADTHTQIG